ncbi:MAG: IclR family transcriptional regulator [Propionibacteriaceae bacterium]|nr:IclR family transcriptional regulator [Propionibacteriaceae bacterium]
MSGIQDIGMSGAALGRDAGAGGSRSVRPSLGHHEGVPDDPRRRSNVPAAANALRILSLLATRVEPVPAARLAQELGLARSTAYHLLAVLIEHGYVIHYPDKQRYGLGLAAHELSSGYQRQTPLQRLARPVIQRLVDQTTHNAHLVVLSGRDVLYVIEERAAGRPLLVTDVGVRLPATITASGLAILAGLGRRQVAALFPDAASLPEGGPATPTELRRVLADVRSRGYATETGSVTPGLSSVANAVPDRAGHPVAAIALTYDADQVTPTEQAELRHQCAAAAGVLASRL